MQFDINTNLGTIRVELNPAKAPKTVENFVKYAESGFYNGTLFHRVIPEFMVQGGGFEPGMTQKTTLDSIENEANNGLLNTYGTIAMARTNEPHSATSQFFINVSDNPFLNYSNATTQGWGYCVFGKVVGGDDVLRSITQVRTGRTGVHTDVPEEDLIIESITAHVEEPENTQPENTA